ncbi:MAG: dTDP-4-dehydrorhamnose reductase [Prevotellaceae bacterium]|nr:dTDP-4-dehydrorhamnose reductase [Prevotellaceae bacterium]
MNVLVTGANGQLGKELRGLSQACTAFHWCLTDVEELDICDKEAVWAFLQAHPMDVVVNCAAFTDVERAEETPEACMRLNATAPGYLAEAAGAHGAAMIHISTDYVFDGTACVPYSEEALPCPVSVYGTSKLAGEREVMARCNRAMIIRTAWLYSPHGTNFVKKILHLAGERQALGVVADQTGSPTYARDLARAIVTILEHGIVPGIYNYTDEGVCSWYEFARTILRMAGITACRVTPLRTGEYPVKAARPAYSVLDKTKIKRTFGVAVPHWEASLAECIAQLNV